MALEIQKKEITSIVEEDESMSNSRIEDESLNNSRIILEEEAKEKTNENLDQIKNDLKNENFSNYYGISGILYF